jgi:hypothetical protein
MPPCHAFTAMPHRALSSTMRTSPWIAHLRLPPAQRPPPRGPHYHPDAPRTRSRLPQPGYQAAINKTPPTECRHRGDAVSSEPHPSCCLQTVSPPHLESPRSATPHPVLPITGLPVIIAARPWAPKGSPVSTLSFTFWFNLNQIQ